MLKNTRFYLFLAVVYTVVLIYLTLGNPDEVLPDNYIDYQDKILHLLAYTVLAILWGLFCLKKGLINSVVIVFISCLFIGVFLEYIQDIVNPIRQFDYLDMLANCIGVFIGTIVVAFNKNLKLK